MPEKASDAEQAKQARYRDARSSDNYETIWQSVGKCVFCDLKEKYIFFEENNVVMTISLFAYIDGHFMIIPRRHVRSTKDLTQLEWDTIRKFSYMAKKIIKEVHGIKGVQLVQKDGATAQSTVSDHIHFHCIPFDAPDLCEWNYRKLAHTPLENVARYKQARKKLIEYDRNFSKKYSNHIALPIACDALIINTNNEILFQHRKPSMRLQPDWLTPPGGHVDNLEVPLESELVREIFEETGMSIDPGACVLFRSRVGNIQYIKAIRHINARYPEHHQFLWNTYIVRGVSPRIPLQPGSDSESLEWIGIESVQTRQDISPQVKEVIQELTKHDN